MRTTHLIAAAAIAVGGIGLVGCQSDADTRHAEAGSYDSQRMNDRVPSGSPSTGAGVGAGTKSYPDARQSGGRIDAGRGAGGAGQSGTAGPANGTSGGSGADVSGGGGTGDVTGDTSNDTGLTGTGAGTGTGRTTGTSRRVAPVAPGDRGGPPAGGGVRGNAQPGVSDNIDRAVGNGGNSSR